MSLEPDSIRRVSGFGEVQWADGYVFQPETIAEIAPLFDLARAEKRTICLRGAGRSYGDASIDPEQIILDLCNLILVLQWDPESGVITVEPGVTIQQLWQRCLQTGWWPPVVPGTMHVTLGGALAMNIHGKNHFRAGSLGQHVLSLDLLTPDGKTQTISREDELFNSIIGGAGLLGIITKVTLQMHKITSGELDVTALKTVSWAETLAYFDRVAAEVDYLVGWVDMSNPKGHAVIHHANYSPESHPASMQTSAQELPPKIFGFPKAQLWRIMRFVTNPVAVKVLNGIKFALAPKQPKTFRQSLVAFSFLLDYVPNWQKCYRTGFLQFQVFLPKEEALEIFPLIAEMQRSSGFFAYLAVLKRHRPDPFTITWALDGYSLAMDFPVHPASKDALIAFLHEVTDVVLACGGRFYLAKDSTLRPEDIQSYLGQETIDKFQGLKSKHDPENLLQTQLARRVGLI
ncbi:MAG: FAD-binding oxidoreductase [Armatimonadetes bacterium]|nr:FAD-binding oxidoreductase [Armatimonadota bacterium]